MGLAESFKALADPQRREILLLLRGGRQSAGELAERLGVSPSALSYHLKALKKADMVIEYKEKNFVYYELNTSLVDWKTRIIYVVVLLAGAVGVWAPMPGGALGQVLGALCSPVFLVVVSGLVGLAIYGKKGGEKA